MKRPTPFVEPAPSSAANEAEIASLVSAEQLRMVLAHTAMGTVLATTFGIFLAAHLRVGALGATIASAWVSAWIAAKLGIALARIGHAHLYRRHGSPAERSWQRVTTLLLAIDGAVWGTGGAWLMSGSTELVTFVTACLCSVAAIATFGLQVRLAATAAYVVPMLAPVSVALLYRGDDIGLIGGVGIAIFVALLLSTARRWETRMQEVFRLRIVTERVSQERKEALALAQLHSTAKDRFLAVVSHELRTPLHGILGLTRLARGEVPRSDGALHYHLELIEEAGEHLKRMVNDLLDISSIEAGRLELKLAPLDLAREIMLLRETYHARAMEAGIRFTTLTRGTVDSWVTGDDVRVAQVLHNLLGNAFKFTPLGGEVSLTVRREPGSAMVEFEIRDSGPGIAAQETERVFEIFVQGSARAGSRPEGVGLGLSIARQLARAMGGDVRCISEPGKGSNFVFSARLPLADIDGPKDKPESTRLEASRRQSPGRTVAIAEDDALSALVSASTVRRLGFDIEEFGDGRALVARLTRAGGRPDLVLMDWDMPRLNGKHATIAIREHERAHGLPPVPIIGLSANASPGYAAAARRAGMDEFVAKPCPPAELAKLIEAFISRPGPTQPLEPATIEASSVRRA